MPAFTGPFRHNPDPEGHAEQNWNSLVYLSEVRAYDMINVTRQWWDCCWEISSGQRARQRQTKVGWLIDKNMTIKHDCHRQIIMGTLSSILHTNNDWWSHLIKTFLSVISIWQQHVAIHRFCLKIVSKLDKVFKDVSLKRGFTCDWVCRYVVYVDWSR